MESPIRGASPCAEDDPNYPSDEEVPPDEEEEVPAVAEGHASKNLDGQPVNLRTALEEAAANRAGGGASVGEKRGGGVLAVVQSGKKPCLEEDEDALLAAGLQAIADGEAREEAQNPAAAAAASAAAAEAENEAARARGDGMSMTLPGGRVVFIANRKRVVTEDANAVMELLGTNIHLLAADVAERREAREREAKDKAVLEKGTDEENRCPPPPRLRMLTDRVRFRRPPTWR